MRDSDADMALVGHRWVNLDPTLKFVHPGPPGLLDYWQRQCRGRSMPARADIDPRDMPEHLPHLLLIDIEQQPLRLRYRLIGTAVVATMERDSTGCYYDELYGPELLQALYVSFDWILRYKKPLRAYGEAFYPDKEFYWYEVIYLPLSPDDDHVDMVLCEIRFHGADVPPPN